MDVGNTVVTSVISIIVAVLTYLAVNRLGEWQKRKMYSRLGVAIIESLQEEVWNGIDIMKRTLDAAKNGSITNHSSLPNLSWEGMSTIPDEVLLRILETSKDKPYSGQYALKDCRIHCKNYFNFICGNYASAIKTCSLLRGVDRTNAIVKFFENDFIQNAEDVYQMLEQAKKLLDKNSRARMPR
jgi:hypothetical protein